ncbi:hypothetical protein [Microvirga sp. G4-2]
MTRIPVQDGSVGPDRMGGPAKPRPEPISWRRAGTIPTPPQNLPGGD